MSADIYFIHNLNHYVSLISTTIMKKPEFSLDDFTMSAHEYCKISSQRDAEEYFAMQGFDGKVALEAVTTVGAALNNDVVLPNGKKLGKVVVCWVCRDKDGSIVYIPLFDDEYSDVDELYYESSRPINAMAYLEHNGVIFLVGFNGKGKAVVRVMTMYFSQFLIEMLAKFQGLKVNDVYLVKMSTIQDNRFIAACWSIVFDDVDDDGEIVDSNLLMPVDVFESTRLSLIGVNSLNSSPVRENEIVKVSGLYYTVKKDAAGKSYLSKNAVQLSGAENNSRQEAEKLWAELVKQQTAGEKKSEYPVKLVPLFKKD